MIFVNTLWVKNSREITLSCTISNIMFSAFTQKFKMTDKMAEQFSGKQARLRAYPLGLKHSWNCFILNHFVDKHVFGFFEKFRMVVKNRGGGGGGGGGGAGYFGKKKNKLADGCVYPQSASGPKNRSKSLYLPPFPEINAFLHFTRKFKMALCIPPGPNSFGIYVFSPDDSAIQSRLFLKIIVCGVY